MEQRNHNSAVDLVTAGIVRFAEQPPDNWRDLNVVPAYTVPLLAEDYPAKTAMMWNAAYSRFGMPDRNTMVIAAPKDVSVILEAFRRDPKYRGGGCGIGFKEVAVSHLDELTPLAKAMGAVNIIRKLADGRLIGANTDGRGYALALEEKFRSRGETLAGKNALIIGAGGAARAIAFALAEGGMHLAIFNRTIPKAGKLGEDLARHFGRPIAASGGLGEIPTFLTAQDVVISTIDDPASPLDGYSTLGAIPPGESITAKNVTENLASAEATLRRAKPSLIVSDIRIRKQETVMLRQARELGFETLDGIPMVVNQGIEAFWWLYGEELAARGRTKEEVAKIMREAAAQS